MRQYITEHVTANPAILSNRGSYKCMFCLNDRQQLFGAYYHHGYHQKIVYCRSCITHHTHSKKFIHYIECNSDNIEEIKVNIPFELTDQQHKASEYIIKCIDDKASCLLYAVTGAGKTEMIVHAIAYVRSKGGKVAVVSPRTDVVIELSLRLEQYLSTDNVTTLYGGHSEITSSDFIISTIHQLIYFKEHFDLIIIDEIDAFPVGADPRLMELLQRAKSEQGIFVYLSATPPKHILKTCEDRTIYLPKRYHGRPLPVPQYRFMSAKNKKMLERCMSNAERDEIVLIFFHDISVMEKQFNRLSETLKEQTICVNAGDEERHEKVEAIRNRQYQFVFTTTILERGFTLDNLSVWVINSHQFKADSLIQIAGRVDRKGERKNGSVIFFHDGISLSMIQSVKNIKMMNEKSRNV